MCVSVGQTSWMTRCLVNVASIEGCASGPCTQWMQSSVVRLLALYKSAGVGG